MNAVGRSVLAVHTKPVEGHEEEFDSWYSDVHLPEVLRLDGFVAARRFRFVPSSVDDDPPLGLPFLAVYEVEEGRLAHARAALAEALQSSITAAQEGHVPVLATSDALHPDRFVAWYEEIAAMGPVA